MLHPILTAQALGLDTTTPGWREHARHIEAAGPWTDGALFGAPEGDLIERAARTRAAERYPLRGSGIRVSAALYGGEREIRVGDHVAYGEVEDGTYALTHAPTPADLEAVAAALEAREGDDGGSDGCPPAAIRHVLAGCLVYELAVGGGFRYGTPPPADARDLARLPETLRRADLDPDYPDAPHYAVAVRVLQAWLGMSSSRDPEGPVGGVGSDPEQVPEGVDLAIRLLASAEPIAEIVADAAATVLHGGRAKAAARARRMLRAVAPR